MRDVNQPRTNIYFDQLVKVKPTARVQLVNKIKVTKYKVLGLSLCNNH